MLITSGMLSILSVSSPALETAMEAAQVAVIEVDGHPIHTATWGDNQSAAKPWIVLISGPIDSWHSDSAWFAAAGPALAEQYRVLAVDRAGSVNAVANAPVGYTHFATDLAAVLLTYKINNATLVAFASGNLTAQQLLQDNTQTTISSVVLIDPDVLTPTSIERYSLDAAPFKQNLDKYLAYISDGKYTERVTQKNQADMKTLVALAGDKAVDWEYVKTVMDARLKITNQHNLFREIAQYDQDLIAAASVSWPTNVPTVVIDSQFEQEYIDHTEDQQTKQGLLEWQQDGQKYYQYLAELSDHNRYVEVDSRAHLFQFEQPLRLLSLINELRAGAK